MPESSTDSEAPWIDLPGHEPVRRAAERWLSEETHGRSLIVRGAEGVGKSRWLQEFARMQKGSRLRWAVARFGSGEPATPDETVRRWCRDLSRWVERPARFETGEAARRWVDLATSALALEGFRVVRAIEADRSQIITLNASGLTKNGLILSREPFRGSEPGDDSVVLPVWSHDELATVLAGLRPDKDWTDFEVAAVWDASLGHASRAVRIVSETYPIR